MCVCGSVTWFCATVLLCHVCTCARELGLIPGLGLAGVWGFGATRHAAPPPYTGRGQQHRYCMLVMWFACVQDMEPGFAEIPIQMPERGYMDLFCWVLGYTVQNQPFMTGL